MEPTDSEINSFKYNRRDTRKEGLRFSQSSSPGLFIFTAEMSTNQHIYSDNTDYNLHRHKNLE